MLNLSFIFLILITLFVGNAALSVFLGIFFAYYFKISNTFYSRRVGTIPLQIGIVILGATISMPYALNVSSEYLPWISLFVIISFFSGLILGGLLGLLVVGSSLNVYSQIALIILIGLSAKNGILIVEFANQLRKEGKNLEVAVFEAAAIRLRPILMTSLSTIIGW